MLRESFLFQLKMASAGALSRPGVLLGFIGAFLGPLVLLGIGGRNPSNLPWYFWGTVVGLLALVFIAGFLMFTRNSDVGRDISISPDRR
jgi:uncharacterized membrane protein YeaQ/YmgE (transglycosylase-associated protein family)